MNFGLTPAPSKNTYCLTTTGGKKKKQTHHQALHLEAHTKRQKLFLTSLQELISLRLQVGFHICLVGFINLTETETYLGKGNRN